MIKNTLGDLNNHLFEQLERLNDIDITQDELKTELDRSKGITNVATRIIETNNLILRAEKTKAEYDIDLPSTLKAE